MNENASKNANNDKLRYIIELDGLRGIAILLVMIYHFSTYKFITHNVLDRAITHIFKTGWIGVILFFVLSGFLITSILLNSKNSDHYFSTFYIKRLLRIFPLYYLYLALVFFVIYPLFFDHASSVEQSKMVVAKDAQVWFWFYLANIKEFISGTFFGGSVSHLWSLSIEEQFYVVWPIIVLFFPVKNLKFLSIVLVIIAVILRIVFYFKGISPGLIYSFTLTRMDSIIMGALVAIIVYQGTVIKYNRVKIIFIIFTLLSIGMLYSLGKRAGSHAIIYTIGFSIIGIAFALLVTLLQSPTPFLFRYLFSNKILVFFGKYSYALYLIHPFVKQLVTRYLPIPGTSLGSIFPIGLFFIVICFCVSITFALLSWNLYEKWFLKLKKRLPVK